MTESAHDNWLNLPLRTEAFSSAAWLAYFQRNKVQRLVSDWSENPNLASELRLPLIRSLQRFQIGETGDGKHLRKYASGSGDEDYIQCIDLFVKEEQEHARLLAKVIASMDGTLLEWHWTDFVFVVLRRLLGLKTEILILFIAEIIGKCFYEVVSNNVSNSDLSKLFAQIVRDELGHLEFHCEYLRIVLSRLSPPARLFTIFAWAILFYGACIVFVADHYSALRQLKMPLLSFLKKCSYLFVRTVTRILAKDQMHCTNPPQP